MRTSCAQEQATAYNSVLDMEMHVKLALVVVVISTLVSYRPTEAWYKQVAGPSYYSVGRASGLLSGIRRSPYIRRAEPDSSDSGETTNSVISDLSPHNFILKTMVSSQHLYKKCKGNIFKIFK